MSAMDIGAGIATGGLYNVGKMALGKGKKANIDIGGQLAQLQAASEKNRGINKGLFDTTSGNLNTFKADSGAAIDQARTDFAGAKGEYTGAINANVDQAKSALRQNLYGDTFNGMPDALRAIREASAAGGGLDTGSYQKQVNNYGVKTAQTLGQGERDIQLAGLDTQNQAQSNIFNAFNQLSQKLTDSQLGIITKALDTGDANAVRQAATSMGINDTEAQGIIDLMNFKQSGQMASESASEANKYALLSALIGGGAKAASAGMAG